MIFHLTKAISGFQRAEYYEVSLLLYALLIQIYSAMQILPELTNSLNACNAVTSKLTIMVSKIQPINKNINKISFNKYG